MCADANLAPDLPKLAPNQRVVLTFYQETLIELERTARRHPKVTCVKFHRGERLVIVDKNQAEVKLRLVGTKMGLTCPAEVVQRLINEQIVDIGVETLPQLDQREFRD